MAESIYDIIELSFKTGKVPKELKRADITPLIYDYRTVSLTSIVCKICEKVIKKQWTEYLEREEIIT